MSMNDQYRLITACEDYILHHRWVMFLLTLLIILLCLLVFRVTRRHIKLKHKSTVAKKMIKNQFPAVNDHRKMKQDNDEY